MPSHLPAISRGWTCSARPAAPLMSALAYTTATPPPSTFTKPATPRSPAPGTSASASTSSTPPPSTRSPDSERGAPSMAQFYTLLTQVGQAKLANAMALGEQISISQLAVGDGGGTLPTPDSDRTALVNEQRRAPINLADIDPDNPNWIVV